MHDTTRDFARFAADLYLKGLLMVVGGAVALLWPNETFVVAMMFAGSLLALLALYEITLAFHARSETRGWTLAFADGVISLCLALLTITLTAIPLRGTMLLAGAWLALTALFAGTLAIAVWPMPRTRIVLVTWCALNAVLAVLAVFRHADIFALLYAGAAYAIAFGLFNVASAAWMRHFAGPEVAPPIQTSWHPHRRTVSATSRRM